MCQLKIAKTTKTIAEKHDDVYSSCWWDAVHGAETAQSTMDVH